MSLHPDRVRCRGGGDTRDVVRRALHSRGIPPLEGDALARRGHHVDVHRAALTPGPSPGGGGEIVAEHHARLGPGIRVSHGSHAGDERLVAGHGLGREIELVGRIKYVRPSAGNRVDAPVHCPAPRGRRGERGRAARGGPADGVVRPAIGQRRAEAHVVEGSRGRSPTVVARDGQPRQIVGVGEINVRCRADFDPRIAVQGVVAGESAAVLDEFHPHGMRGTGRGHTAGLNGAARGARPVAPLQGHALTRRGENVHEHAAGVRWNRGT